MKHLLITIIIFFAGWIPDASAISLEAAVEKMLNRRTAARQQVGADVRIAEAVQRLRKAHGTVSHARRPADVVDDFWASKKAADRAIDVRNTRAEKYAIAYLEKADMQEQIRVLTGIYYQALRSDRQLRLAKGNLNNFRAIKAIVDAEPDEAESREYISDRIRKVELEISRISDSRREALGALSDLVGESVATVMYPRTPRLDAPDRVNLDHNIEVQTAKHALVAYQSSAGQVDQAKVKSKSEYRKAWEVHEQRGKEVRKLRKNRSKLVDRKEAIIKSEYRDWIQLSMVYEKDFEKSLQVVNATVEQGIHAFAALDAQGVSVDYIRRDTLAKLATERAERQVKMVRAAISVKKAAKRFAKPPAWNWSRSRA